MTYRDYISLFQKSCQVYSPVVYCLYAGGIWKGDIVVADFVELE